MSRLLKGLAFAAGAGLGALVVSAAGDRGSVPESRLSTADPGDAILVLEPLLERLDHIEADLKKYAGRISFLERTLLEQSISIHALRDKPLELPSFETQLKDAMENSQPPKRS